jgi:MarR family transcriptional regulator, organic hydroperoxide resistance regulator
MPNTSSHHSSKSAKALAMPRGAGAWLAVVRTYQQCTHTLSELVKPLGLKLAQHEVLMHLLRDEELSQQHLASRSFVTKSHMSGVIVEMIERGWLARSGSDLDRRAKLVRLTPEGRALALQALATQNKVIHTMMDPLTDRQVIELERISLDAVERLIELEKSIE